MINKIIKLKIITGNNIEYNDTVSNIDKLYFPINNTLNNNNENIINLYSNINYNIYLPNINDIYYFVISEKHKLNIKEIEYNSNIYKYIYGINDINFNTEIDKIYININYNFTVNDIGKEYNWYIYKLNNTLITNKYEYSYIRGGLLKINNPLLHIKLNYKLNKLIIHDITDVNYNEYKDDIRIENSSVIEEIKENILLFSNINYIFEITNLDNQSNIKKLEIYYNIIEDYNKISEDYIDNISIINDNKLNINKIYKWKIGTVEGEINKGNIIILDLLNNVSNNEILYDYKFKDVNIKKKIIYNKFDYKEYLNIIYLNNNINYLLQEYSNKLLIIDNTINNVTITLPSNNIYIGLIYNILLLNNLLYLNINCEDNELRLEEYDMIKGGLFISNKNNKYCKVISSGLEYIDGQMKTDLSKSIMLKTIKLKTDEIYNTGLNKYGLIQIICVEKNNNKYVWNIQGNLIGNSVNYINTYLFNPFI